MGSRSKRSKTSSSSVHAPQDDDQDKLLVLKGSLPSTRSASPEVVLQVNEKFAQAFEERKRKEELVTLEKTRKLHANDDDDETDDDDAMDSETEDEDGEELTRELDADIRNTLQLIRKKDPAIYDASITFFRQPQAAQTSEEDADMKRMSKTKKKAGPLYYKDMVRQQAIAGDVSGSDEDDKGEKGVQTYAEEQKEIKNTFLASLEEEEGEDEANELEGGLFTMRKKSKGEREQENEDYEEFASKYGTKLPKGEMDPDHFLEHYLSSEGWKDRTAVVPHYDEIVKEDEEDAEALEKAEEFEHTYNFRFEEQGSSVIQTHARQIDDTMRREDDSRKRKRAERKERKALERQKKEEELRRLKNLKQAEVEQKLKKVARLMGEEEGTIGLKAEDLEGDFDRDEYDKRMQAVFDEQYYDEDDDMEKPTWDEDKELFAGLPVDPEDEQDSEGGAKSSEEAEEEDDEEKQAVEEEAVPKHTKLTTNEMQRQKQKYLDELYSLDYEDLIGDIKCRFKYRQVQNNDFGLTADEIMAADDKELKQLVSLKRIAPYADSEYSIDRKRLKNFKKSVREAQKENRRRKYTEEAVDGNEAQKDKAEQHKKKRKRSKKKVMEEEAKPEEGKAVSEEKEPKPKSKKAKSENAEPATEKATNDVEKKKKRRSKKKRSDEKNGHASTGLSTSRLESYKLVKTTKN